MRLVKVKHPEVFEPISATCPNHWMSVIIEGKCDLHTPKEEKEL